MRIHQLLHKKMGLGYPRLASSSHSFSTRAWLPAGATYIGFPKGSGIYQKLSNRSADR